jgi:hypothetical protein
VCGSASVRANGIIVLHEEHSRILSGSKSRRPLSSKILASAFRPHFPQRNLGANSITTDKLISSFIYFLSDVDEIVADSPQEHSSFILSMADP